MTLESWLERATRLLAPASVEKVRAEIGEHYQSALEAELARGKSREDAERATVESLGNPAAAGRGYRKVLLTAQEARLLEFWKTPNPIRITWPTAGLLAGAIAAGFLGVAIVVVALAGAAGLPMPWKIPSFRSVEGLAFLASVVAVWCIGAAVFALQGWRRSKPVSEQAAIGWVFHALPVFGAAVAMASYVHFGFEIVTRFWASSALVALVTVTASTWPINTPKRSRAFRLFKWATLVAASLLLWGLVPWLLVTQLWGTYMNHERERQMLRKKLPFSEWPPQLCR
jgi:hypothetical protein